MSFRYPSRAARVAAFAFVALLASAPAFAACGAAPTAAQTDSLLRLKNPAATTWSGAVGDAGSAVAGDFVYDGTNNVPAFCNGTSWVDVAAAGGNTTLNGIMAATANQAGIANAAYTIQWNWDTLTTGTALKIASTSMTTGSLLNLSNTHTTGSGDVLSASTASTTAGASAVYGNATGATGTAVGVYGAAASATGYGGYFTNTNGGYALATSGGNVGFGTTTPTYQLHVHATGTGAIRSGLFETDFGNAGADENALALNSINGNGSISNYVYFEAGGAIKWEIGNDCSDNGGQTFCIYDDVASADRLFIDSSGNTGIGTGTPGATLDVAGTVKLGTAGTAMSAMGVCTVASYTPNTATANKTCTGVPASTSVAVHCSASGAFSTTTANGVYARATGTVNQIAVNTNAANTNSGISLTCMWVQP